MLENKKRFVEAMSTAMVIDQRSQVTSIEYISDPQRKECFGIYKEVVRINFVDETFKLITVDANSNMAIAKEILCGIYGPEATGTFFCGDRELFKQVLKIRKEQNKISQCAITD